MTRYALWTQPSIYPASQDRQLLSTIWPAPASSGLAVTVTSGTTLGITPGIAAIPTANATGTTLGISDATESLTLATAPGAGTSRIDLVCVQTRANDLDGGGNNDLIFTSVTGTAAASPVAPATPAGMVCLYQATVPASPGAVTLLDVRPWALRPLLNGGVTVAPTAGVVPLTIQGAASQSADLLDIKNSSGTTMVSVSSTGSITMPGGQSLFVGSSQFIASGTLLDIYTGGDNLTFHGAGTAYVFDQNITGNRGLSLGGDLPAFGGNGWNGGTGPMIMLGDASAAPTSNPSWGGILYSTNGVLFYRSKSGTITQIAPAAGASFPLTNTTTAGTTEYQTNVTGDTQYRFTMDVSGILKWGTGAATADAQMYRASAGVLNIGGINSSWAIGDLGFGATFSGLIKGGNASATTGYALLQDTSGNTYVNAATGGTLYARIANATVASLSGNGTFFTKPVGISGTGPSAGNWLTITNAASTDIPLIITGAASQTADLLQLKNSGATKLSWFDANGTLNLIGASGAAEISTFITGDTNARFYLSTQGNHAWGPGNAAADVYLVRNGAGALQVQAASNATPAVLYLTGSTTGGGSGAQLIWANQGVGTWMFYQNPGDANFYFRDMTNSRMQLTFRPGASTTAAQTTINSNLEVDGYASIGTTPTAGTWLTINPTATTDTGISMKAIASQTGDFFHFYDSSSVRRFWFDANWTLNSSNPTTAALEIAAQNGINLNCSGTYTFGALMYNSWSDTIASAQIRSNTNIQFVGPGGAPLTRFGVVSGGFVFYDGYNSNYASITPPVANTLVDIVSVYPAKVPLYIKLAPSATSNALEIWNAAATPVRLAWHDVNGNLYFGGNGIIASGGGTTSVTRGAAGDVALNLNNPGFGGDQALYVYRGGTGAEYMRVLAAAGGGSGINNVFTIDRVGTSAATTRALWFRSSVDGTNYTTVFGIDTPNINGSGVFVGSTPSWGGGTGPMMFLANDTADPTTNPAGGVILFSSAGVLKARDPSGTVTQIAPAIGASVTAPLTLTSTAAAMVPLTLKGSASQSGDLLEIQNSSGTNLAVVTSTGSIYTSDVGGFNGNDRVFFPAASYVSVPRFLMVGTSGTGATAQLSVLTAATGNTGISVKLMASATGDTFTAYNSGGSAMMGINNTGQIYLGTTQSFGGGTGPMVFFNNDTADPSSNPVGGVILFSSAGVLKARDPSGAVTQIAPAVGGVSFPLSDNTASNRVEYQTKLTSDTQYRITIDAQGLMTWSGGAAVGDVGINRYTTGLLTIGNTSSGGQWSIGDTSIGKPMLAFQGNQTVTGYALRADATNTDLNAASGGAVNCHIANGSAIWTTTAAGTKYTLPVAIGAATVTAGTWLGITLSATTDIGLLITGVGSQTGDYLQVKNNAGTLLQRVNNVGTLVAVQATASGFVEQSQISTDTQYRFQRTIDGSLSWGGGTSAFDMQLYRPSAGQLTVAGNASRALVNVAGGVAVSEYASASVPLTVKGAASQSGDLLDITTSTSTKLSWFDSSGMLHITAPASSVVPLTITGAASQGTEYFRLYNNAGTCLIAVDQQGYIGVGAGTAGSGMMGYQIQIGTAPLGGTFAVADFRVTQGAGNNYVSIYHPGTYFNWQWAGSLQSSMYGGGVALSSSTAATAPALQVQTGVAGQSSLLVYGISSLTVPIVRVGTQSGNGTFQIDPNCCTLIQPQVSTGVPLTLQGYGTQTGDLLQAKPAGTVAAGISATGQLYTGTTAAISGTWLTVQAAASSDVLLRLYAAASPTSPLIWTNTGCTLDNANNWNLPANSGYYVGSARFTDSSAGANASVYTGRTTLVLQSASLVQINGATTISNTGAATTTPLAVSSVGGGPATNIATFVGTGGSQVNILNTNTTSGWLTTPQTELVLEQTGDTNGITRLHMQNRGASGGMLLENTGLSLVDINFSPLSTNPALLRFEGRTGAQIVSNASYGEFQWYSPAEMWVGWHTEGGIRSRWSIGGVPGFWGGGSGPMLYLANDTADPTSSPTSGVLVYSSAGVLKARDPSGQITTLAPGFKSNYVQTLSAPTVASSPYTVSHNLGTTNVLVELWDAVTMLMVQTQVKVVDNNNIQISVSANMPNNINVIVFGVPTSQLPVQPGDFASKAYVDARTPNLPAAVTSGSGVQSFTDTLGDVWVALNGVRGGNWYRARDVIHGRWYRNAGWSTSGTANTFAQVLLDTASPGRDPYGLFSSSNCVAPVPGLYSVHACVNITATAANQIVSSALYKTGAAAAITNHYTAGTTGFWDIPVGDTISCVASDTIGLWARSGAATQTGGTGQLETFMAVDYLGTG